MNINENIRNKSKLVEKLRGIPTKLPLHQLLTILYYKIWYQINLRHNNLTKMIKYILSI